MSRRKRKGRTRPEHAEPPRAAAPPLEIPTHRKVLYSAVIFVLFFGFVEVSLALVGVKPVLVEEDPYVGFASTLELFEPTGSGTELETAPNKLALFNPQRFRRAKGPGSFRIFTLGGSTTYGRPFEDGTSFSGWLRAYLASLAPARPWEVINAGGISYGSYRVAKLMEELVNYEPDLFIIYSGNNEFLERRTYHDLIEEPEALTQTRLLLQRTRIWSAARKIADWARSGARARYELTGEVEELLDSSAGLDYYQRDQTFQRQVLDHYRFNLQRMILLARSQGARVLLVTVPVNEQDFSPFKSQHRDGMTPPEQERHAQLLARAAAEQGQGRAGLARELAAEAVALDPLHAQGHYLLGRALLAEGETERAAASFERAIAEDVCPLRALPQINESVAEAARRNGVPLVDFRRLLKREMSRRRGHPILGEEFFLDHVHPTVEANGLLARELVEQMAAMGIVAVPADWRERLGPAVRAEVLSRVGPDDYARANKNLSKVLIWAGKKEEAQKYVRAAAEVLGDDWEVHYNAGVIHEDQGDPAVAIESFREAIRLNPAAARAYDRLGSTLASLGELERAIAAGEKAVAIEPEMAGAWNNLGVTYGASGDLERALEATETALRLEPDFAEAHNNLGNYHLARGELDEAMRSYTLAIELRPRFSEAMANRGIVLGQQGKPREALEALSAALALNDRLPAAHLGRGKALLALEDLPGATAAFEKVTVLDPLHSEAHVLLARCLVTAGERPRAKQLLVRAIRNHPTPSRLQHAYGRILAGEGSHDAAAEAFRNALETEPGFAAARIDLGRLRTMQGRYADAILIYREVLAHDEENDEAHHALATALLVEDRLDEGQRHLEQAIRLNPRNAVAAKDLAIVYEHRGRLERALQLYREAARLDPGLAIARDGADRLRRRLGGG